MIVAGGSEIEIVKLILGFLLLSILFERKMNKMSEKIKVRKNMHYIMREGFNEIVIIGILSRF